MKRTLITVLLILCIPYLSTADILLFEDFEHGGALPLGWSLNTPDPDNWTFSTNSSKYWGGVTTGPGDYAAVADSDLDGGTIDAWLITPSIDCSAHTDVSLQFHHFYKYFSEVGLEGAYIFIAVDGSVDVGDTNILYEGAIPLGPGVTNINISPIAANQPNVKIGFRYLANNDWHWIIDDVTVTGTFAGSSQTQETQEITPSDFITEQDGEKDIIIGRNKIYTSKNEQVHFYAKKSADITIYTMDGIEVKTFKIEANNIATWPGEDIPSPGTYIASIKIEGRDKPVIRKILVLR